MLPVHVLMLQASGTPQGQSPFRMLFMFGAIFAIFYFLLIRPQRNQQKKHDEMVAALSKGDEVATTGSRSALRGTPDSRSSARRSVTRSRPTAPEADDGGAGHSNPWRLGSPGSMQ